jgi:hypothetical protein
LLARRLSRLILMSYAELRHGVERCPTPDRPVADYALR